MVWSAGAAAPQETACRKSSITAGGTSRILASTFASVGLIGPTHCAGIVGAVMHLPARVVWSHKWFIGETQSEHPGFVTSCTATCCMPAAPQTPRFNNLQLGVLSRKPSTTQPTTPLLPLLPPTLLPVRHHCCSLQLDLQALQLLCAEAQGGAHGGATVHGLPVLALGARGLVGINRLLQDTGATSRSSTQFIQ